MADAATIWMSLEERSPARPDVRTAELLIAFTAWQHGDAEAFESLVEQLHVSVYRVALRLLGDRQDAEDAVQETFWRLYRAGTSIRVPVSVYPTTDPLCLQKR